MWVHFDIRWRVPTTNEFLHRVAYVFACEADIHLILNHQQTGEIYNY